VVLPVKRQIEVIFCGVSLIKICIAFSFDKAMVLMILLACEEIHAPLSSVQWLLLSGICICWIGTPIVLTDSLNINIYEGKTVNLPSHQVRIFDKWFFGISLCKLISICHAKLSFLARWRINSVVSS